MISVPVLQFQMAILFIRTRVDVRLIYKPIIS